MGPLGNAEAVDVVVAAAAGLLTIKGVWLLDAYWGCHGLLLGLLGLEELLGVMGLREISKMIVELVVVVSQLLRVRVSLTKMAVALTGAAHVHIASGPEVAQSVSARSEVQQGL